ncbi:hypothetical protein PMAYCL1PPCAC_10045, partial [Pristionchus mayeri]
ILSAHRYGGIMYVDFNTLFNQGEEMLTVPVEVPFPLVRNLIDGEEGVGSEGRWRKSAETTLEIISVSAEILLNVMQAFIYDPLIEFGEDNTKQIKTELHTVEDKGKSNGM